LVQRMIRFHEGPAPVPRQAGHDSGLRTRGKKRKEPPGHRDWVSEQAPRQMRAFTSPSDSPRKARADNGHWPCTVQTTLPGGKARHQVNDSIPGSGGPEGARPTEDSHAGNTEEECSGGLSPATSPPVQRGQTTDSSGVDPADDEAWEDAAVEV
jgi:hypothetical protein